MSAATPQGTSDDPTAAPPADDPGPHDRLGNRELAAADLADWRKLAQALHARFAIPDYRAGAAFVGAVAEAAADAGHHPELRLIPGAVDVALGTREDGLWVTGRDVALAARISEIARAQGLAPEPAAVTQLELALDTADEDGVAPFWSALLTGRPDNRVLDSVLDPTGRVPSMWFQPTDSREPSRQRWHFDLWVAPEAAASRIAAAVAAGGTVVDDSPAPSFTVLADRDGNRVCVCTQTDRD
jgi:4a-hydroxytetrahydrobiopterin dehydratase